MKKISKKMCKGFTLIEMLVVVLIIGILAGIALPQYQNAVAKTKIMSMIPLMKGFSNAFIEWKLSHGEYYEGGSTDVGLPNSSDLGVSFPSDWECDEEYDTECSNSEWSCGTNWNGDGNGDVRCIYRSILTIEIKQNDDGSIACSNDNEGGTIMCIPETKEGEKICKSIGTPYGLIYNSLQCTKL